MLKEIKFTAIAIFIAYFICFVIIIIIAFLGNIMKTPEEIKISLTVAAIGGFAGPIILGIMILVALVQKKYKLKKFR